MEGMIMWTTTLQQVPAHAEHSVGKWYFAMTERDPVTDEVADVDEPHLSAGRTFCTREEALWWAEENELPFIGQFRSRVVRL